MNTDKSLYQIALTHIKGVGVMYAHNLMQVIGDEEAIFKEDVRKLEVIPRISRRLIGEIRDPEVMRKAEKELNFVMDNKLRLLFFTDEEYPQRLTQCIDAPLLLYAKGNTDFNHQRIISVIGTRNATRYGEDFCKEFIEELSHRVPDIQIISGLAYGIDICAHRAALKHNLSTVAVLAHGLDRIYPQIHRQTAVEMLQNGALLTEFPSGTNPDKHNFVKRNRIVAGMADAVVVIESGEKGGSLTTADIANSYYREVFALPGRIRDKMSIGCNRLISENKALLLQSINSFISHMGWETVEKPVLPEQQTLFHDLSEEETMIFEKISNTGSIHVNTLAIELNIPVPELFMTLLELEVKNIVMSLPGGMYRLA
ncbi:DNA-processing protein DprA [Proteiniphilum acetatigenes]|uniref:DNA-processing protein DprA n=1 Tax=Proteiniphilum acetatigenes TaxID=294710 RepID=UPI00039AD52A|nr:DNA-processing protein DprA [Proteiniphilum acetatigenes]SFL17474.1 DNA processing protein [Porphyromonadaceae bacterium KH3CP3RA]